MSLATSTSPTNLAITEETSAQWHSNADSKPIGVPAGALTDPSLSRSETIELTPNP
jgi:hypothetical protein